MTATGSAVAVEREAMPCDIMPCDMVPARTRRARAKLNLALHVRMRQADGYHNLETLFAFVQAGDDLATAPARDLRLKVAGPESAPLIEKPATDPCDQDNLVIRAARRLQCAFGISAGADMRLIKNLPVASGLGGGSSDAATILKLLIDLWDLPVDEDRLHALACELGADVPACWLGLPALGRGRGEQLEPLTSWPLAGLPVLLVNPRVSVPTGPVFHAWDGVDRGGLGHPPPMASGADAGAANVKTWLQWLEAARNDLEKPAIGLAPEIARVLDGLRRQPGARLVRMSGSGATCFALFENAADRDAACRQVPEAWWTCATTLC